MSTDKSRGRWRALSPYGRHLSLWMLIRVRTDRMRLTFPLPLFVFDQALVALEDLGWLADRLFPGLAREWLGRHPRPLPDHFELRPLIRMSRDLLNELRRYGAWRMVEVDVAPPGSPEVRVYIDFI